MRSVYRVPLLVTGPGVLAGGDLYAMNPAFTDPGRSNPAYSSGRPIRTALVANLVTKMLGLPRVPGSRFGRAQDLTVSGRASPTTTGDRRFSLPRRVGGRSYTDADLPTTPR